MRKLALAVLLLAGCVTTDRKMFPPETERERKLARFEELATTGSVDSRYDSEWRAAMICAELADEKNEHFESKQRREFAKLGMTHADRAIKLHPDHVEGHYYKCITLGRYLELSVPPEAVLVADLRDEGERTALIDEKFEWAGAHRFLGIFYYKTPTWGPYNYGDFEKADAHFTRMLEVEPNYPENQLEYGKYQHEMKNDAAARDAFKKALDCIDHSDCSPALREQIRIEATEELRNLGN
jgi:hypothetical protein